MVPAEVKFTGDAGGRTTVGGAKLVTLTVMPVTPAVANVEEKVDAKLAGGMLARPVDTPLAADALVTAMVKGTDREVAWSRRRVFTTVMPDTFTKTAVAGRFNWAAVALAKALATVGVNWEGEVKPLSVTEELTV